MTIPNLESYCLVRNPSFKSWWVSDRNAVIYDFGTHVGSVGEAAQILRRQFSGETTLTIHNLKPSQYGESADWIAVEVILTPERSKRNALLRGLKVNNQAIPVIPSIASNEAGAYMVLRISGLPADESPVTAVGRVRESVRRLFPSWANEKIGVSTVFPELRGEFEDEYHGSIVALLEDAYPIPKGLSTAYLQSYNGHYPFEARTFHYHVYCKQCREVDSHTTTNCRYFHPYGRPY
ncbi:hypothetical protein BX666DRAFT_1224376 [Dichotomocladium elegans]|nr:hypothetical protein BX666DRAFT_1224376 [Dichotomocladium elegans]